MVGGCAAYGASLRGATADKAWGKRYRVSGTRYQELPVKRNPEP
ncbi:MAG: hypothetical protein RBS37_04295 [Bacteroidales bacterium]|nr:hypothetical protein [Bacteroidales bacterium]